MKAHEIKFRAYIPALKMMLYYVDVYANGQIGISHDRLTQDFYKLYHIDEETMSILENGTYNHIMSILPGEEYIWFEAEQFHLMQLLHKDHTGIEYWQGDLFSGKYGQQKDTNGFIECMGAVEYDLRGIHIDFNFKSAPLGDIAPLLDDNSYYWRETGGIASDDRYYKIVSIKHIGNIYEHPHLLTNK